jgi:hypothetical protein
LQRLRVPDQYRPGLEKLGKLKDADVNALVSVLGALDREAMPTPRKLAPEISTLLRRFSSHDIRKILELLFALYVVRAGNDVPVEQFADDLASVIESRSDKPAPDEEHSRRKAELIKLLTIEPVNVASKVTAWQHDSERQSPRSDSTLVWCTDRTNEPLPKQSEQEEVVTPEVEAEFRRHVEQWRKETLAYSSIARKIAHPDYLAIISMRKKAIPLLLRELEERPTYWFAALKAVAKDEQPPDEPSSFDAAVKAWLDWGKKRGYLQERGTTGS